MLIVYFIWTGPAVLAELVICEKKLSCCMEFEMWRLLMCEVTVEHRRFHILEHFLFDLSPYLFYTIG